MKSVIKTGIAGLLLVGVIQTASATTNYWVQNVNLKLSAYVQQKATALRGTLPTKQFLAFLSGITNYSLAIPNGVRTATNTTHIYMMSEVTNSWLLPNSVAPPANLPRSYTVSSNYVLTPDGGGGFYTNNINFTNDVIVNRTDNGGVTYTFNNAIVLTNNKTAYLLPEFRAPSITAVWTNHSPGTVFLLSGYVLTNDVTTVTNYTSGTNPDFTRGGTKLLLVTTFVNRTNYGSHYIVRTKNGKQTTDVDISTFMAESSSSPYITVSDVIAGGLSERVYGFGGIDFNNGAGTSFNFIGFDTQSWARSNAKNGPANTLVLKQRSLLAGNYGGYISGQIKDRKFSFAPTVVKGSITFTGGKWE